MSTPLSLQSPNTLFSRTACCCEIVRGITTPFIGVDTGALLSGRGRVAYHEDYHTLSGPPIIASDISRNVFVVYTGLLVLLRVILFAWARNS